MTIFANSIMLAGLLLGGCAGAPKQAVTTNGTLPATAGWSFGFPPDDATAGEMTELAGLERQVRRCLTDLGATAEQNSPAYIVQWSISDRPGSTNVFVHDDAPSEPNPGAWVDGKAQGKRASAFVTIGVMDAATAQQIYHVSAAEHHGRKADAARPERLIALACEAMRSR